MTQATGTVISGRDVHVREGVARALHAASGYEPAWDDLALDTIMRYRRMADAALDALERGDRA
jgi:uncharacterized ferritin-like protein (DUF455 family)